MTDPSDPIGEPGNLRFLRLLVTTLMVVMIGGLLVIVSLFVIRFSSNAPPLPDSITLPDGVKAEAFTVGRTWYGVVTNEDTILIFDRATGKLSQTITVE
jgi:uncharacterized protein DUF6476